MAKDISKMTEDELRKYAANLERDNATLTQDLQEAKKGAALDISGDAKEGYLITTPNPTFFGNVCGVYFANGRGFVPGKRERKDVDGKIEINATERLLTQLEKDFGYKVSELDEQGIADLRTSETEISKQINAATAQKVRTRGDNQAAAMGATGIPDIAGALQPK